MQQRPDHEAHSPRYDVALTFAGEDRTYVRAVAQHLRESQVAVFFDEFEQVDLWGKDLAETFDSVFRKESRFVVMFISRHYAKKAWTIHERRSALSRALTEKEDSVLPVRFDDTDLEGLRPTIGYVDLSRLSPEVFAGIVLAKLGKTKKPIPVPVPPPRRRRFLMAGLLPLVGLLIFGMYLTLDRSPAKGSTSPTSTGHDHVASTSAGLADLVVAEITQPRWDNERELTSIQVRVKNIGTVHSGRTSVKLIDISTNDLKGTSFEREAEIPVLDVQGEHTVTLTFPYWLLKPNAELIAVVDPKNQVAERDEKNNTLQKKFIG